MKEKDRIVVVCPHPIRDRGKLTLLSENVYKTLAGLCENFTNYHLLFYTQFYASAALVLEAYRTNLVIHVTRSMCAVVNLTHVF